MFNEPTPFAEAMRALAGKRLLPTSLDSAGLRQLAAAVRRQSLFSARTTMESYLEEIKAAVGSVLEPQQVTRVDEDGNTFQVTEGLNPATARQALREKLQALGYAADPEQAGTLSDLSSDARINLVVKTNVEMAQGAGRFVQQNADPEVVDQFPALELVRFEDKEVPRDWEQRWMVAAQVANDPKAVANLPRMVALKSSGIWQELGDGAGGHDDTLGNPYPPFAFNSGMWTQEVDRDEAIALGLIEEGQAAEAAAFDFGTVFNPGT
jgi:hypothetical protein